MGCSISRPAVRIEPHKELPAIINGVVADAVMRIESLEAEEMPSKRTPIDSDEVSRVLRGGRDGRVLRKQT